MVPSEPIVIARAPLTIGLAAYEAPVPKGGHPHRQVVHLAIRYFTYTIVTHGLDEGIQIIWAGCPTYLCPECKERLRSDFETALTWAISQKFSTQAGLKVFLAPQMPLAGSLSVVGSLCVSMIKALALCSGVDLEHHEVAEFACQIESEMLGTSFPSQEAYAAAYGGLTCIDAEAGRVAVESLQLSPTVWRSLERSLMLFQLTDLPLLSASSPSRSSALMVSETRSETDHGMNRIPGIRAALESGDLPALGQLLSHSWQIAPSTDQGDLAAQLLHGYQVATAHGALGGQGIAANHGSFLALLCREEAQAAVTESLAPLGMARWPLRLASGGVEILEAMPRTRSPLLSPRGLLSPFVA